MARHSTMHANHGCRQGRAEEPDPGDRAHDAPARCAGAASRAARAEADLAVYGPASVDRPPHPRRDVGRSAGGPRRTGKLPARHAAARARQSRQVAHQRARARPAGDARAACADRREVNLSVRHGDEIVYVERSSSGRSAMRVVHVIGARAPLHVTAAGKLFLLEEGFARLRDYAKRTGLAPHTKNTMTNLTLLERDLERIQRQGWAVDAEEAEIGVRCVAAGVRDDGSSLVAALSLSTPADRMKLQWGPLIKETADQISRAIGHRPTSRIGVA